MTNENSQKMLCKIFISGIITVKTGLHIGGNSVGIAIGGVDNVIVRDPFTNYPYIPGSSLRGKMRSLLERARGSEDIEINEDSGGFSSEAMAGTNPKSQLGKLFGVAADEQPTKGEKEVEKIKTPTRLIVRDAQICKESVGDLEKAANLDMPFTEVKTEVAIDRITSAANPRQIERVPAGTKFKLRLILTLTQEDNLEQFLKLIDEGLDLVQDDTLGGHGSRGYGQVKFEITELWQKTVNDYRDGNKDGTNLSSSIPKYFKPASPKNGEN